MATASLMQAVHLQAVCLFHTLVGKRCCRFAVQVYGAVDGALAGRRALQRGADGCDSQRASYPQGARAGSGTKDGGCSLNPGVHNQRSSGLWSELSKQFVSSFWDSFFVICGSSAHWVMTPQHFRLTRHFHAHCLPVIYSLLLVETDLKSGQKHLDHLLWAPYWLARKLRT